MWMEQPFPPEALVTSVETSAASVSALYNTHKAHQLALKKNQTLFDFFFLKQKHAAFVDILTTCSHFEKLSSALEH